MKELEKHINNMDITKEAPTNDPERQYYYIKKYSDRRVLHELYCSESTYYKLKHYICERILALCACNGLVDEKEIVLNLR